MAAKKKTEEVTVEKQEPTKYMGSQLLKMQKYNLRVARIVIKPNERYSFDEADALISNFMKKKG